MTYYQNWIKKYDRLRIGYISRSQWTIWTKWHWYIYFSNNEHWNYEFQEVDFKYIQCTILGFQIAFCYKGKPPKK